MLLLSMGLLFLASTSRVVGFSLPAAANRLVAARYASTAGADTIVEEELVNMEALVSLCKRRGFLFPSSEIYGGLAGFFDYGPLGVELKQNIKDRWWRAVVRGRDDIVGLDSSIISSPKIWKASGHVDGFSDPMVDCKETKLRFRADQVFFAHVEAEDGESLGYLTVIQESGDMAEEANQKAMKMKRKAGKQGGLKPLELRELTTASQEEMELIPSPSTGTPGALTSPREFNLMFQTNVGAYTDGASTAYLRPETAQGIFSNFKNVQQTTRMKVPFGIAQIGKAFRNEITPRNFIFRSREFEQMEVEYFIEDDEGVWKGQLEEWIDFNWEFLTGIGLREDLMGKEKHEDDKLAHYARACTDITFKYPFGESELMGIAARGCYDLTQHQDASGKSMEYFDEATKNKYVPHVIEPSLGVDRLFLALMTSAYAEDEVGGEKRTLLRFHPSVAPVKCAVFPLMKNKPELVEVARKLYDRLRKQYNVSWDIAGAIGRRYRRADEAGTPFCVTVDFESLEDDTVTIRYRDDCSQERLPISEIPALLTRLIEGDM
ncbi:unnamed protein product [Chrysoparadoxa australica]